METKHTPGPWRWEFNAKHKSMHLVGGVPRYDLTVMDFERWGFHGACVRLREDVKGMNIMHRLPDRQDWIKPFPNRDHHASWCASVDHPDMRLIAAAPYLLAELQNIANANPSSWDEETRDQFQQWAQNRARAAIAKATGEA
jgi:hypothetical protein